VLEALEFGRWRLLCRRSAEHRHREPSLPRPHHHSTFLSISRRTAMNRSRLNRLRLGWLRWQVTLRAVLLAWLVVFAVAVAYVVAAYRGANGAEPSSPTVKTTEKGLVLDVPNASAKTEKEMKPYTEVISGTKATFDMVPIPGGKFRMGSPSTEKGRQADEGPQHEVTIEPFWMGKTEVTWDTY